VSPTVSVIIPTYNHRDFVAATLESVFAQTYTDYEVIVVNDGSPDDTAAVLRPFVESGRIRYFEQPNAGQAAARNRGLAEARGTYIAFLDDDDLWPADKLHWQVNSLDREAGICAIGGSLFEGFPLPQKTSETLRPFYFSEPDLFYGCPFHSPGQLLIRTNCIKDVGGLDPTIWGADDFDLYLRLARRMPIKSVGRPALFYRIHSGNASKQRDRLFSNSAVCLRRRLRELPRAMQWKLYRRGFRWLYNYLGRDLLRRALSKPVSRSEIVRAMAVLHSLWPGICRDPRLAFTIFFDIATAVTNFDDRQTIQ
jgi:glycosyltransferase involved in cell wall biosynthesis